MGLLVVRFLKGSGLVFLMRHSVYKHVGEGVSATCAEVFSVVIVAQ